MVLLTMIARVADGLPLAASMQEDEQVGPAGRVPGGAGLSVRSGRGATYRDPLSPFSRQGDSAQAFASQWWRVGGGEPAGAVGLVPAAAEPPRCVSASAPAARSPPSLPSQSGRDLQQYQSQAKQLFRKLNEQSPTRCTLEAGAMAFQ